VYRGESQVNPILNAPLFIYCRPVAIAYLSMPVAAAAVVVGTAEIATIADRFYPAAFDPRQVCHQRCCCAERHWLLPTAGASSVAKQVRIEERMVVVASSWGLASACCPIGASSYLPVGSTAASPGPYFEVVVAAWVHRTAFMAGHLDTAYSIP